MSEMTNDEFDAALVAAAFTQGADQGWRQVSPAAAAHRAGLDLVLARCRFAGIGAILSKFGENADIHALNGALTDGNPRERLFDILLRRFDYLQIHRAGVLALLKAAPLDPALAAWLAAATYNSMGWMLEAAGIAATGLAGSLRKNGLLAVWAWGLRAWVGDGSDDLTATMAAVDVALQRASQIASRLQATPPAPEPVPFADPELPLVGGQDAPMPVYP